MKVIELALYRLAEAGKLSLEQSKILKFLCSSPGATFMELLGETSLDDATLALEINDLLRKRIVSFSGPKYHLENFPEKISELIREEKAEILGYSKVR